MRLCDRTFVNPNSARRRRSVACRARVDNFGFFAGELGRDALLDGAGFGD